MIQTDAEQLDAVDGQVVIVKGHRSRAEGICRDDIDAVRIAIDQSENRDAAAISDDARLLRTRANRPRCA